MNLGIEILDRLYDGLKFRDAEYKEKTNICVVHFLYNPEHFKPNDEHKKNILTKHHHNALLLKFFIYLCEKVFQISIK